jgi:hypothetical protein
VAVRSSSVATPGAPASEITWAAAGSVRIRSSLNGSTAAETRTKTSAACTSRACDGRSA